MEGVSTKRKRNVHFSKREEELLVELVRKRRDIIENKTTDAVIWRGKEDCWKELAVEFNSNALLVSRTVQQLQLKYKNLKRNVRKKNAAVVQERRRTGGGANEKANLNDVEEKVKGMILFSVDGMTPEFDCDEPVYGAFDSLNTQTNPIVEPEEEEDVDDVMQDAEVIPDDELQALGTSTNFSLLPQDKEAEVNPAQDQASTSRWNSGTQPQEVNSLDSSVKCSWDKVTPQHLKLKKSTPLRSRKKRYNSMTAEATNILRNKEDDMRVKKKYMETEIELNEQKKINILLERDVLTLERERKSLEIEKMKLEILLLQDKVKKQCSDSV